MFFASIDSDAHEMDRIYQLLMTVTKSYPGCRDQNV